MKGILGRLEFALEREIVIRAPRATVFRFFTDSARWAKWWGEGSTIDGRVGGALSIAYPGGTHASGEVLELRPNERIVFSYGYEGEGKPIAPGGSRVTVTLSEHPHGTALHFRHELADAATRDNHVQGWRYHLAVFANAVANEVFADVPALVERWVTAWNEPDDGLRRTAFRALVSDDVVLQDAYSCTRGFDDLVAHVAGGKVHMRGITIECTGAPRQCQGTALADFVVKLPDGKPMSKGTNVFELAPDGRIERVVGLWG
ncbi:MAG: SRPBCC domain-containing protein [Planctomycetes bacterium]|nr:SRPBCC domain-containing protein [Planctomycetota bacterium]